MDSIKETCPYCGGTIVLKSGGIAGECEYCANNFTLSELQKIQDRQNDYSADLGDYTESDVAALNSKPLEELSMAEICKLAEVALQAEKWEYADFLACELLSRDAKFANAYLIKLLASMRLYKKEELARLTRPFASNPNYRLLMRFADTYLQMEIEGYCKAAEERYTAAMKEKTYRELCEKVTRGLTTGYYLQLIKDFSSLGEYKDSTEKIAECQARIAQIKKKRSIALFSTTASIVLITALVLSLIFGAVSCRIQRFSSDNFEISVTGKQNLDYDSSYVWYNFDFEITNNGKVNATRVEGYMTVKNSSGETLLSGDAYFSGTFMSKASTKWDLEFRKNRNDDAVELWNLDFNEMTVYFRITEITFESGRVKSYKNRDDKVSRPTLAAYETDLLSSQSRPSAKNRVRNEAIYTNLTSANVGTKKESYEI